MELELQKFINTKNRKKVNMILDKINSENIFPHHRLLEKYEMKTIDGIALEYIITKSLWDYDNLMRVSVNVSLIKNNLKAILFNKNSFQITNNFTISINKVKKLGDIRLFQINNNISDFSLFNIKSKNADIKIMNFINNKIEEYFKKGIPINIFDFFIYLNEKNNPKVLNTIEGINFINEIK